MNQMTKWLFDTTYLLPFQGFDVKIKNLKNDLENLFLSKEEDIAISSCSIIECKWSAIKQFNKHNDKLYLDKSTRAINHIFNSNIFTILNSWEINQVNIYADELRSKGMTDLMDCWILGTARVEDRKMISEDKEAREFIEDLNDWKSLEILNWKEFKNNVLN